VTTIAIHVDGLTKRFPSVTAVDGLTLSVARGELFGLVGPDGAGKTTTIRMLASIMRPDAGSASVAGFDTVHEAEAVKKRIGYMSQRFGLYEDLTVDENIAFYADLYGVPRSGRRERIEELLRFSDMGRFRARLAGKLSGGMKQKLGLMCALVHTPEVLLLDEPTNGVDPVSRRDFWRILGRLVRDGVTVFVSTAYLDEAERCARVALLHAGRLLACGSPDEVKRLVTTSIFEVRAAEPRAAARTLRSTFGAAHVGLFGDKVHVATSEPDEAEGRIRAALAAAGDVPTSVRHVPPALEDVFVSILGAGADASSRECAP